MTCSLRKDEIFCNWNKVPTSLIAGDKLRVVGQTYASTKYPNAHPDDWDIVIQAPDNPHNIVVTLTYPTMVNYNAEKMMLTSRIDSKGACDFQYKWQLGDQVLGQLSTLELVPMTYLSSNCIDVTLSVTPCYGDTPQPLTATINFTTAEVA